MEENNNVNNNKNKKKIIIGSIGIVLLLLVVVIGSTYAYFSLNVNGEGTNTKVTITTGSSNQIKLSGGLQDFHIKLEVKDMAYNRVNSEYYATSKKELNYEKDKTNALTKIGEVEIIGELEERHTCTAEAKVTLSGSMASLIKEGDLELSLQSEHYSNTSDLTEISNSYPATLTFILEDVETSHIINAYLKFTNRNTDQSYLAGQTLNVSIIIEDFKCTTDTVAPELNKFYFNNENEEQQYTSNIENTLYLSWLDEDVKEYCITTNETSEGCQWKPTDGKQSISEKITLDGKEGDHIYYGYIKDNAGNISTRGSASIIYDSTIPTIDKFYIKEEGTPKYTNQNKNKVYFTYNDNNIKDMCVSEEETSDNCKWTTIGESMDYTFANNTEGLKTIYGYVRDKAGNISDVQMKDTITYDKTLPVLSKFYIKEDKTGTKYTNLQTNKVYFQYSDTNIKDMCVTEGTSSSGCSWVTIGSSTDYKFTNTNEGTKTVRGYVRDKAGNISSAVVTSSIVYDKTAPTINTISTSNLGETSVILTVTANSDTSGISQYCYSTSNSSTVAGTCQSSSTINLSGLKELTSYTYYFYLKDNAGNSGIASKKSYTFKTKAKPVKNTLTTADKNNTIQTTPFGGLYRYYGKYDVVKYNYICFGTSDKTQCLNNPDTYMYRIIGVTDGSEINTNLGLVEGQMKVIKATQSAKKKKWNTLNSLDVLWDTSDMYKYLNGTTDDTQFLYTIQHLENGAYWDSLITSQNWYMEQTKSNAYGNWNSSYIPSDLSEGLAYGKIGLMYVTDYLNSNTGSKWLRFRYGWSTNTSDSEWTMSRYGQYISADANAWASLSSGSAADAKVTNQYMVRPVFYLTPNITLTGEGTETNPFIINS